LTWTSSLTVIERALFNCMSNGIMTSSNKIWEGTEGSHF
jgi:hypothetical protein